MTTIKLAIERNEDYLPFLKEGNKIVRIAFNLFRKGDYSKKEVKNIIKQNYSYDSKLINYAKLFNCISDAKWRADAAKKLEIKTFIFGEKKQWKRWIKGLISKEEFNKGRNEQSILFIGGKDSVDGNRHFRLDLNNQKVIFKEKCKIHHSLKIKGKISKDLLKLSKISNIPITYRIAPDFVTISFDEKHLKEKEHVFKKDRIASLDMNPNYIGFVITDEDRTIYKHIFDLTKLTIKSDDKIKYELFQIAKRIVTLCQHYQVEFFGYEKLDIGAKDHGKGKNFNRLVNGKWKKNIFVRNLIKRLNIVGIRNKPIVAAYSSTIGCANHPEEADCIAAALEIGRRARIFKYRFLNKKPAYANAEVVFPAFDLKSLTERWNSRLNTSLSGLRGWKDFHALLKREKKLNVLKLLTPDFDFRGWEDCFRDKSCVRDASCSY
jgi:hypothetical protein